MCNDLRLLAERTTDGGGGRQSYDPGPLCVQGGGAVGDSGGTHTTPNRQTLLETEPQTGSTSIVQNITLQEGDNIELGNKIHAATLGARYRRNRAGKETHVPSSRRRMQDISKVFPITPPATCTGLMEQPMWISMGCQPSNR